MSFMITCPICGARSVHEFRYGAEDRGDRSFGDTITPAELYAHVHERSNVPGPQKELWFHRDGCETWVTIWRDTRNDLEVAAPPQEASCR